MTEPFDEETALALAAKLDGFDLSDDERAILRAIFTIAADDVTGFATPTPGGPVPIPYPNVALGHGARSAPLSTSFLAAFRSRKGFVDGP